MVKYKLIFMSQAQKDAKKISQANLKTKLLTLLKIIEKNPFSYPPQFEHLKGDMSGLISRRINKQHRLVYEVFENDKMIKIYRMYGHYD